MADFPTFEDLFRIARDEALTRNSRLKRNVLERQGTDANALVASSAAVGDEVIGQLAVTEAGTFLSSAKGAKLDRVVFDRYGLLRKPASPSVGSVVFSVVTPNPAPFTVPTNTRLQTPSGLTFITSASYVFAYGATSLTAAVRSVQAGLSQQAQIGTITSILDLITGAPADLTVANTVATAGADDAESDDSYRDRAQRFFTTARRGTVAAIETAAIGVSGVRTASAFEVLDALGRPAKAVQLAISDAFTEQLIDVTPVPAAYQTQSQVLASTVYTALYDVRAAGIFVDVFVAAVVLQGVHLALLFRAGANVDTVALQARAAVVNYMNELSPGSMFDRTTATNRLRSIRGLYITGNEIISPVGNVIPQQIQVLRTTLALVAAVSVQPDQALQGSANPDTVGS